MPSYIQMPKLSDTMTEGTVVKWRKALGEKVEIGDVVAEVETDKAVMELEAFGEGTLSEIYVPAGGKARIGVNLAALAAPGEAKLPEPREHHAAALPSAGSATTATPPSSVATVREAPAAGPVAPGAGTRVKASPLARKLALAKGMELASMTGSGPGGRIVARDVESAVARKPAREVPAPPRSANASAAPVPAAASGPGDKRIPLSGMRRSIAERLVVSKTQIPHFYLQIEVDAAELLRLRAELNAALEKAGQGKLTVNDFVLRAATMAAVQVPRVNASFAGDAIIEYADVHLAVAVAIEEGLVTPVIREAQKKSLRGIREAVKDLANRARSKRLKPEEYQGGTLTVSTLGSYGIESFSAIINPPQAAILSVGAIVKKPVVSPTGQVVPGERMCVGLSADHRVVDGAIGAQYLNQLRQLLENPMLLLF